MILARRRDPDRKRDHQKEIISRKSFKNGDHTPEWHEYRPN